MKLLLTVCCTNCIFKNNSAFLQYTINCYVRKTLIYGLHLHTFGFKFGSETSSWHSPSERHCKLHDQGPEPTHTFSWQLCSAQKWKVMVTVRKAPFQDWSMPPILVIMSWCAKNPAVPSAAARQDHCSCPAQKPGLKFLSNPSKRFSHSYLSAYVDALLL